MKNALADKDNETSFDVRSQKTLRILLLIITHFHFNPLCLISDRSKYNFSSVDTFIQISVCKKKKLLCHVRSSIYLFPFYTRNYTWYTYLIFKTKIKDAVGQDLDAMGQVRITPSQHIPQWTDYTLPSVCVKLGV